MFCSLTSDRLALQVLHRLDIVLGQDAIATYRGIDREDLDRGDALRLRPGKGVDCRRHPLKLICLQGVETENRIFDVGEVDRKAVILPDVPRGRDVKGRITCPGRRRDMNRAGELGAAAAPGALGAAGRCEERDKNEYG
jgi:hypothetical protein